LMMKPASKPPSNTRSQLIFPIANLLCLDESKYCLVYVK
jgi:hypothetical protein